MLTLWHLYKHKSRMWPQKERTSRVPAGPAREAGRAWEALGVQPRGQDLQEGGTVLHDRPTEGSRGAQSCACFFPGKALDSQQPGQAGSCRGCSDWKAAPHQSAQACSPPAWTPSLPGQPLASFLPLLRSHLTGGGGGGGGGGGNLDLPASEQPHPSHSLFLLPWLFLVPWVQALSLPGSGYKLPRPACTQPLICKIVKGQSPTLLSAFLSCRL